MKNLTAACMVATLMLGIGVSLSVRPVGGETINRVVAIVNNELVTLYELNARIKEMAVPKMPGMARGTFGMSQMWCMIPTAKT